MLWRTISKHNRWRLFEDKQLFHIFFSSFLLLSISFHNWQFAFCRCCSRRGAITIDALSGSFDTLFLFFILFSFFFRFLMLLLWANDRYFSVRVYSIVKIVAQLMTETKLVFPFKREWGKLNTRNDRVRKIKWLILIKSQS